MKTDINVTPLKKVGRIEFGMTRDVVRKVMGTCFTEFRKSEFSKNTTDDFGVLHVFYNEDDQCIAVEVFDDCGIIVDGLVLPTTAEEFKKWLLQQDGSAETFGADATSMKLSIGMCSQDNHVESILFGAAGYYG